MRLVGQGSRYGLVKDGSRQAVEIPSTVQPLVAWVMKRDRLARQGLAHAFPGETPAKLDKLLADLGRMALIEAAA